MQNGNKVLKGPGGRLVETEAGGVRHLGDGLCRDLGFRLHSGAGEKKLVGDWCSPFLLQLASSL